jgi:hypothetical protein
VFWMTTGQGEVNLKADTTLGGRGAVPIARGGDIGCMSGEATRERTCRCFLHRQDIGWSRSRVSILRWCCNYEELQSTL